MRPIKFALFLSILAITAAGCGRTPVTVDVNKPAHKTDSPKNAAPADPRSPFKQVGPGVGQQDVRQLLSDVAKAFGGIAGYRANLETTDTKGGRTAFVKSKITYGLPDILKFEIVSNSDAPSQAGTKALWRGGKTIDVRPSGLLGFAKVSLKTTDERVKTLNGYTIDQINVKSALKTLLSPQATVNVLGNATVAQRPIVLVDVSGITLTKDTDHQRIGIDTQTKLPISVDLLRGSESKYALRLVNMVIAQPNPSELNI